MKKHVLQIFRSVVTVVVVGTMAMMIFSLREENAKLRARVTAASAAPKAESDGVYVLCRFDLNQDADISDYIAKTMAVVPTVRAENCCQMYALLKDAETDWDKPQRFGERTLWMVEKWDSIDALKAHIAAPHMKAFGPTVRGMRRSGTFHVLQEVR
jgi:quinol monooxygenase YgiN